MVAILKRGLGRMRDALTTSVTKKNLLNFIFEMFLAIYPADYLRA
jgi:hypothetical protein